MTTPVIGILSYEDMKARTLAITRGQLKSAPGEPKVWGASSEALERFLSDTDQTTAAEIIRTAISDHADRTST